MILGQTRSALWAVTWPARAAVFSRLHGVKNRERRPASSTGKSRARQGV